MTQRRWGNIAALLAGHRVAASVYFVALLVLPGIIAGILMVVLQGGMLMPLFLVRYVVSVVIGGVVFLLISLGLQLLRRRVRFPWWSPVVLASLLAFVIPTVYLWDTYLFSLFVCIGFCTYWASLSPFVGQDMLHRDRGHVMSSILLVLNLFVLSVVILAALFVQGTFMEMFEELGGSEGLESLPKVTRVMFSVTSWQYVAFALVLAGALVAKEYALRQCRKKLYVNLIALCFECVWALIYALAFFKPLYTMGAW